MRKDTLIMLGVSLGLALLFILLYPKIEPYLPVKSATTRLEERVSEVEADLRQCRAELEGARQQASAKKKSHHVDTQPSPSSSDGGAPDGHVDDASPE